MYQTIIYIDYNVYQLMMITIMYESLIDWYNTQIIDWFL